MTHIVFAPVTRPAKGRPFGRFAAGVLKWWNQVQEERRLRATMFTLHRLNDRTLRDIGLERDCIEPVVRSRGSGRSRP